MLLVTLVSKIGMKMWREVKGKQKEDKNDGKGEALRTFFISFFAATDFESKEHSLAGLDLNSTQDFVAVVYSLILLFDMKSHEA